MRILITGGSGFIGTSLVSDLLLGGHDVVIFDNQPSAAHPKRCVIADVRDRAALVAAFKGADAVYHLAAEHRDDVQPISLYYDVNVGGAQNVVEAARINGVSRIVFTSTVALYGLNVGMPDETFPTRPFNDYGRSKFEAEKVFASWAAEDSRRSLVMVRPAVIFGENNRGNVYNLLSQLASGRFVMVGNGQNKKSMGYVKNISRFLVYVLDGSPGVSVYNYADKPDLSTEELVEAARMALGQSAPVRRVPYGPGLAGGYFFDILARLTGRTYPISSIRIKKFCANTQVGSDKAFSTGFEPPYTLEEGLQRMIAHEF